MRRTGLLGKLCAYAGRPTVARAAEAADVAMSCLRFSDMEISLGVYLTRLGSQSEKAGM